MLSFGQFTVGVCNTPQIPWRPKTVISRHDTPLADHYFYMAPFYDGGRFASFFIPLLVKGRHYLWWDTGVVLAGSSIGYRYRLDKEYFGHDWFMGIYFALDRYGLFGVFDQIKNLYRSNIGFELNSARIGQFSLNIYGFDPWTKNQLLNANRYLWFSFQESEGAYFLNAIDKGGYSIKWCSIPSAFNFQITALFARSSRLKTKVGKFSFLPESVMRFGLGCQLSIKTWAQLELQWIIDQRQKSVLRIGFQVKGMQSYFQRDAFQGRLSRPPQRHIPNYLSRSSLMISSRVDPENPDPVLTYSKEVPEDHQLLESGPAPNYSRKFQKTIN